jgi:signal peptide peptidase SppA
MTELLPVDGAERRRFYESDDLQYRHVLREVARRPWALHPATLAAIVDLLTYRSHGHRITQAEIEERVAPGQARAVARRGGQSGGGVAVLPLYGVIAQRAAAFQSVSSPNGTSVEEFTRMLRAALADDSVESILIEIDSPGGSVDMVPELAAEVRNARGQKPIVALANTLAASAAYWIGSQADELVVTPSGEVGSIGVYAAHEDLTGVLEQEGVKMTLISAGKFKTEGNPFEPLSDDARAHFQSVVDDFYGMFVGDVAKGRGVSVADVRGGFGEGRVVQAKQAVKMGMADRVATYDQTVARMMRGGAASRRNAEGIVMVPISEEFAAELQADWTPPLQMKLEAGELVYRQVDVELAAGPVAPHSTAVIDEPWDGPGQEAKLAEPITKARGTGMYAWYDESGNDPDGDGYPDAKADWKFPHHRVSNGDPGPANVNGVRNALARLTDAKIPEGDKAGVRAHLQRHLDDFNKRNAVALPAGVRAEELAAAGGEEGRAALDLEIARYYDRKDS